MENSQNSWVISETMDVATASTSRAPARTGARRKTTKKINQKNIITKTEKKAKTHSRGKRKRLTGVSYIMIAAAVVFVVCTGLLFQQSLISELNEEVRTMQGQLDEKKAYNDSKDGQLMSGTNDMSSIEATARNYGMTTPSTGQYIYETKMDTTQRASTDNQNTSWLRSILQ